jgi:hypothetical protein
MPSFYQGMLSRILERKPKAWADRAAFAAAAKLIDPLLVNRLLAQVPADAKERLYGMAEAANLPPRTLEVALVLPDLLPILQGVLVRLLPSRFVEAIPEVRLGCSSFLANGDRFLVGRNLDFPGVGYWDRYPVIQVAHPLQGLRYASFTTAGVPLGGITGINEAQVFVALHQHFSHTVSLSGQLPFLVAERILTEARSIDEALAILDKSRLASSWAFILADGKTRDAAICETTPKHKAVRRLNGTKGLLGHSNFFLTTECQPSEFATCARMNWDNYHRKTQLEARVKQAGEGMTPAQAVVAIGDHFDPYWQEEKISNRTVSQALNIQSLVLDPERMEIWLARGDCPIHLRDFEAFDVGALFAGGEARRGERLSGFRFQDAGKAVAKEHFVTSLISLLDGEEAQALERGEQSLQAHFTPDVALTCAIAAMKCGQFQRAESTLSRAAADIEERMRRKDLVQPPPEYFEIRLYQGRVADLNGHRAEAKTHYAFIADSPHLEDSNLKRLAGRSQPFTHRQLDRMVFPFSAYAPLT